LASRYLCVHLPALQAGPPDAARLNGARIAALVEACRRYTPLVAPDGPDGLVLDVTGAAHLFGGEAALARQVEARFARFEARTGLADSPEAAWALARFGPQAPLARILPAGEAKALARAMHPLPVAALRLSADVALALSQTGLKTIGDLAMRPRAPIAARFGAKVFARLDAMMGQSKSPISPRFEAPAYVVERRYAEGVRARPHIEDILLALAHEACGLLARHEEGARRLAAVLFRVDGETRRVDVATSRPLRDAPAMLRLFRGKLDALEAGASQDALDPGYGFDLIRLAVMEAEPLGVAQDGLPLDAPARKASGAAGAGFGREGRPSDALADFLDRMSARFGAQRVQRLVAQDSHAPERAMIAAPAVAAARAQAEPLPAADERPLRLFERPEPIDAIAQAPDGPPLKFRWRRMVHDVAAYEGPERIAPEWWREGAPERTRDYFRVEDVNGRRFWLYREGLYADEGPQRPRWFVQGLFA
jgi:protein ImuB